MAVDPRHEDNPHRCSVATVHQQLRVIPRGETVDVTRSNFTWDELSVARRSTLWVHGRWSILSAHHSCARALFTSKKKKNNKNKNKKGSWSVLFLVFVRMAPDVLAFRNNENARAGLKRSHAGLRTRKYWNGVWKTFTCAQCY